MKRALLGLALAAILPVSAQASEISYSYIEAGYVSSDWAGADFDGFSLAGSYGFNESWYGSVDHRQFRNGDVDLTIEQTHLNLGWHHAMSDKADFLAEIGYARIGADLDGYGDDSADGYRAAIGFRGRLATKLEGSIKASYTSIDDLGGGEFGASVGAIYHITPTWGITGSYEHASLLDENADIWGLGVRGTF